MNKRAEAYIKKRSIDVAKDYYALCKRITEPIKSLPQQLFLIEFYYQLAAGLNALPDGFPKFYIIPHKTIKTSTGKKYKVDFMLYYTENDLWMVKEEESPEQHKDKVLIITFREHPRKVVTLDQFEQEEALEKEGYTIKIFSFEEAIENPEKCVEEATEELETKNDQ